MSEHGTVSRDECPNEENNQSQEHPPPSAFDPIASLHATPSHVHSVVPDLMRVYESLTKSNPTGNDSQGVQETPHSEPLQQQQDQVQPQTQHVNYAFITSEEQYRQLYQHQSQDPKQMPPRQNQEETPSSLPYIPPAYGTEAKQGQENQQRREVAAGPHTSSGNEESTLPSSSRFLFRKRNSAALQQDDTTSTSSKPKGRKKAKETDGRWSKRFTWPEELHRDFVSAIFDVGLKHSSPSTILEHMPKHPHITSERVKSHLQKYRVHRRKSKLEYMSSYESTLIKFQAGEMDNVKALTNGEVGAHLTHLTLTNTADPASITRGSTTGEVQQPQGGQPAPPLPPPPQGPEEPPAGHDALMLPKLTEAEKASPIGSSMGYLLGLFFSLKKQLLMQRALDQQSAGPVVASAAKSTMSSNVAAGPVAAVYNSFVGPPAAILASSNGDLVGNPIHLPNTLVPPIMTATSTDWSSANAQALPDLAPPSPAAASGQPAASNPVLNTGSTRNNLEASSMMKREMQNQMAFQNKMRALKQQELNKYKNVPHGHAPGNSGTSGQPQHQNEPSPPTVRFKQPEEVSYVENISGQHRSPGVRDETQSCPPPTTPADVQPSHAVDVDLRHEERLRGNDESKGLAGDANIQGAGETVATARARAPSFSMGGNDDFWNADIMDEQLFEFLMNN